MVGTRPIDSPAARQATACCCIAAADSTMMAPPCPPPEGEGFSLTGGVFVLRSGEGAGSHVPVELASRCLDGLTEFGVLANEFRHMVWIETQDVLDDEHLGVAVRPRADADGRDGQRLRDPLTQRTGNAFQHQGERAGCLERLRVVEDPLRRLVASP